MRILGIALALLAASGTDTVLCSAPDPWQQASENAVRTRQAVAFCRAYANGWLSYADPVSGLLPRNLQGHAFWNTHDCAADNFPFLYLTAEILGDHHLKLCAENIRLQERRLTRRVGALSDDFIFASQGFLSRPPPRAYLVFGAAEYAKDGLLPITEWMGPGPWVERMEEMIEDVWKDSDSSNTIATLPSDNVEVSGDLLMAMSRLYWMTGKEAYRSRTFRLADHYLLDKPLIAEKELKLRDHGSEIIGGLSEAYVIAARTDPARRERWRKPIHELIDCVLKRGTNPDGIFFNAIAPRTGKVTVDGLSDGWGYVYNAVYTIGIVDDDSIYHKAVEQALSNVHKYRNHSWEGKDGADGFADSIEGAINLLARIPTASAARWIDEEILNIHRKQGPDGIIEGWYGDGNSARTTLMYILWKTQGVTAVPWTPDLELGSVSDEAGRLYVVVRAKSPWNGCLRFDRPRHSRFLKLPLDYPRINQFPEWFTVKEDVRYRMSADGGPARPMSSDEMDGVPLSLSAGQEMRIAVAPEDVELTCTRRQFMYAPGDAEEARAWQDELRARLFAVLHIDDSRRTSIPLSVRTISETETATHIRREVEFNSTSRRRIRAVVTIPKGAAKSPAVVCIHGHGGSRLSVYDGMQYYRRFASSLAGAGFATIACDVGQHEVQEPGCTLIGERLWDLMRCVDYLESLPEIDRRRIGCAGLSLGGEMAMWLGAMDQRIVATVSSGFLTMMDQMEQNHCMCWKFPGLRELADFPDIYGLIAPRPLQCQIGQQEPADQFPEHIARKALAELEPVYRDLGSLAAVQLAIHPGGHVMDVGLLMKFMSKHVK